MTSLDPSHPAHHRLIAAVLAGDVAAARTALADGADANTWRDYDDCWDRTRMEGREPVLLAAARQGHTGLVTLLLQHGADPDARDSLSGRTALVAAAARGELSSVQTLLDHRAALEIVEGPSGDTAFAAAIANGHAEVAALLASAGAIATARAIRPM
jgi:ankyrin repeat protein